VLYVTERCVFRLTAAGMELTEIAPGIELDKDILAQMRFKPIINGAPALMDKRIFDEGVMGLRDELVAVPFDKRFTYQPETNVFFVNFEGLAVRSREEIWAIQAQVEKMLAPRGRKVKAIVNYDNFTILPELEDEYIGMVEYVIRFYESVTRYTTSAFLKSQLPTPKGQPVLPAQRLL